MSTLYSNSAGQAVQGVSIDNNRRLYNFGDRIAELAPAESLFLSYLMKLRKNPTDDPVFKHLERRHQWQRRNFEVQANLAATTMDSSWRTAGYEITGLKLSCLYDQYGREVTADTAPEFLLADQTIAVMGQDNSSGSYENARVNARIKEITATASDSVTVTVRVLAIDGETDLASNYDGNGLKFLDGQAGEVIGSAFAEATGAPTGWTDAFYDREGYTQIFKTAIPVISGTMQSTRYRGIADEYARIWGPKLKEHKADMTKTALFGIGGQDLESVGSGAAPKRYSWGIIPYTEQNGTVQNFTYANTSYDAFLDFFESFLAPEKGVQGRKMAFASRKIVKWMNYLGETGFLANSVGRGAYQIQVDNVTSPMFGHNVTRVSTPFGEVLFNMEMYLRGPWEDYAVLCEMPNVHWRPLVANGKSRDTYVKTNVQGNDTDGRKDMVLTEAGLQVDLPETHAILKFS